ncbi:hypothetical protein GGF43_006063, partial [Coemansia sp. RSA 2618]
LLQAFRAGTCALKGLNQQAEAMDAERIFDDWADQTLRAAEVQAVMDDGAAAVGDAMNVGDVDDEELEAELEALLAAEADGADGAAEAAEADEDVLADALNKVAISPESQDSEPVSASVPDAKTQVSASDTVAKPATTSPDTEKLQPERVAMPAE